MAAERREKPLLIWDGECGFCATWIDKWKRITGDQVEYAPFQEVADQFPQIPKGHFEKAVHLVDRDGKVYRAAEAVFRSLSVSPRREWMLKAYQKVPGVKLGSEAAYRLVAEHRMFFSKLSSLVLRDK